jgi:CheY-like chemotaxis protein
MTQPVISLQRKLLGMEQPYKIVLIDDDPISHLISTRLLERFSTSIVEAFVNPEEALKQLQCRAQNAPEKFPDIILLDINMPVMNGWEFLEEFEKLPEDILKTTSVMMLSSSTTSLDREKSKKYYTVKKFLSKPLTEELIKIITLPQN